ncbi:MAG: DUF2946 family protein [Rubrivivax sp.]
MVLARRYRRLIALLAMLACISSLLAPLALRAAAPAAAANDPGLAICYGSGHPAVAVQPASDTGEHQADTRSCPCCFSGIGHAALPALPLTLDLAAQPTLATWPALFLHGPHTLHAWVQRPSRAPPLSA